MQNNGHYIKCNFSFQIQIMRESECISTKKIFHSLYKFHTLFQAVLHEAMKWSLICTVRALATKTVILLDGDFQKIKPNSDINKTHSLKGNANLANRK